MRTLGGFTCPHCAKLNLCNCTACKRFYEEHGLGDRKYCNWTEDGEGFICSYCNEPFSPDDSLDAEYELNKDEL